VPSALVALACLSRISAFGPEGHCILAVSRERCVFHVDGVWKSTRGKGQAHVDACGQREGGQKHDFLVDVING